MVNYAELLIWVVVVGIAAPIVLLLAWALPLVIVIRGKTPARVIAYCLASCVAIGLMFAIGTIVRQRVDFKHHTEVGSPMQLLLRNMNDTAQAGDYELLKRKLKAADDLWLRYTWGQTNLETGSRAVMTMTTSEPER